MARRVSSPVFVGRAAELQALEAALDAARGCAPRTVLVSGESGVGKSRLLTEFSLRARAAPASGPPTGTRATAIAHRLGLV